MDLLPDRISLGCVFDRHHRAVVSRRHAKPVLAVVGCDDAGIRDRIQELLKRQSRCFYKDSGKRNENDEREISKREAERQAEARQDSPVGPWHNRPLAFFINVARWRE